jgi:hypothetical protein
MGHDQPSSTTSTTSSFGGTVGLGFGFVAVGIGGADDPEEPAFDDVPDDDLFCSEAET